MRNRYAQANKMETMKILNFLKKKVSSENQIENNEEIKKEKPKNDQPEFIIIMGGVCTGKTTLRKSKYYTGYVNIDAGDIFIELSKGEYFDFPSHLEDKMNQIGLSKMRECIKDKKNIVIEIIGADYESVKELLDLSDKIKYSHKVDYLECDMEEAWQRNVNRGNDNISAHYCEPYHIKWFKQASIEYLNPNFKYKSFQTLSAEIQKEELSPEENYIKEYEPKELLTSAVGLPDLVDENLFFKLSNYEHASIRYLSFETGAEEGGYIFIYEKNKIIWAEPYSYYMRFQRYYKLVNILVEKYGEKMIGFEFDSLRKYLKYVGSDEALEKLEQFKNKFDKQ